MNCFQKASNSLIITALTLAGCTSVDDTLGDEFIPDDQQMAARVATLGLSGDPAYAQSFQMFEDSLPANRQGWIALGADAFAPLGTTTATALVQFLPATYDSSINMAGFLPVIDSVYLTLNVIDNSLGDAGAEQQFTIYGVDDLGFMADTTLYFDYDLAAHADLGTPLFRFTLDPEEAGSISQRLQMLPAGMAYLDKLIGADIAYPDASDDDNDRQRDSLFTQQFKGLYIAAADPDPAGGIYRIGISYNLYSQTGGLSVYLHNHDRDDPATIADTAIAYYTFIDEVGASYSQSATAIARDYPVALAINDTLTPQALTWVEGLGGLYTRLRLTDALFERIEELRGEKSLALNSAVVYLPVAGGDDPAVLDEAFTRLGMYRRYANLSEPIIDYNTAYESSYGELPYGGKLDRSGGFYKMDITATLQQMLLDAAYPRTISVTPDESLLSAYAHTPLRGESVVIKLIYTLVP